MYKQLLLLGIYPSGVPQGICRKMYIGALLRIEKIRHHLKSYQKGTS